jgi:hypothetical protein
MSSEILILVGTLSGAFIGALSTLGVTWLSKRSEERKHYRELIINLAVENYKEERAMARAVLERRPEITQFHYPLDDYIIHMVQLAELVIDKKIQPNDVKRVLAEMDELTDQVHGYYDERYLAEKERVKKEKSLARN